MSLSLKAAKWRPDIDALELCAANTVATSLANEWPSSPLSVAEAATTPEPQDCACSRRRGRRSRSHDAVCSVCQWVHDPAKANLTEDVQPGTPWSEVPDNFLCPECFSWQRCL